MTTNTKILQCGNNVRILQDEIPVQTDQFTKIATLSTDGRGVVFSMAKQTLKTGKIADLIFDDKNANDGTVGGNALIGESIGNLGLGRSVLADKNGKLIAGNKTTQQAIDQNFVDTIVVETTGEQLVVVKRMDLDLDDIDDQRGRALALADNRTTAVNLKWNPEHLQIHFDAVLSLEMPDMVFDLEMNTDTGGGYPTPKEPEDKSDQLEKMYKIEIEFEDESAQADAFDSFTAQGYKCSVKAA